MEAAQPSRGSVNVFTVVEQEKHRQRAIHWTKQQNEHAYAAGYKCGIADLQHISSYLGAVFAESAARADIHASFYHVELPAKARAYYRFRDSAGDLYQLRVGAMGHCVMPEIMQMITNVLAGNPEYVRDEYAVHVPVQVWIDNVRHYGGRELVQHARAAVRRNAAALNLEVDFDDITPEYDFIGVHFDHTAKTVRPADKTLGKLPATVPEHMRARQLEEFVSRMIFIAGIRQEPLVNNWWLLKWARRTMNGLNSGRIALNEEVQIPPSARRPLQQWLQQAPQPHRVVTPKDGRTVTLFTDATPVGWGAVLVDNNNKISICGGRFSEEQRLGSIATQEAWAVDNAIRDFGERLREVGRVNIFVDNTSVQSRLQAGNPRAADLVAPIKSFWQRAIRSRVSIKVQYISTKLNPADELSRGQEFIVEKAQQAMRIVKQTQNQNTRRGLTEGRFV